MTEKVKDEVVEEILEMSKNKKDSKKVTVEELDELTGQDALQEYRNLRGSYLMATEELEQDYNSAQQQLENWFKEGMIKLEKKYNKGEKKNGKSTTK